MLNFAFSSLKRAKLARTILCACLLWAPLTQGATSDLFELSLEELLSVEVRSADKTDKALKDIPASMTVISRSEIQSYGYTSLENLLQNTPGLYITSNSESTFVGMRGNANGRIQLLVNGIPQHPSLLKGLASTDVNQFNIPIDAIDQVEIIRGPMSVIYGNNAFLGVINVITNQIETGPSILSLAGGDDDNGDVFTRWVHQGEQSSLVLNLGASQTDTFSGQVQDMMSPEDFANLAPGFDPHLDFQQKQKSVDLSARYQSFFTNIRYQHREFDFYPTSPNYDGENVLELATLHASLKHEHSIATKTLLRSSLIYSTESYKINAFNILHPELNGDQEQDSQRLDLEFNAIYSGASTSWITGYRLRHIADVKNRAFVSIGASTLFDADRSSDDFSIHDVFTQLDWQVNNANQVVGGIRLSKVADDVAYLYLNSAGETVERVPGIYQQDALVNWRAAWIQRLNHHHTLRYMVGTAAYDNDLNEADKSEKILSYELNHLATFAHWQINTSVFKNQLADISERTLNTNTLEDTITTNGEWRTTGLESIVEYRPEGNFRYALSALIQSSKDKHTESDIGYSPNTLLKFKTDYHYGDINIAVNICYVGSMKSAYSIDQNQTTIRLGNEVPSYTVLELNSGYQATNRLHLNLKIRNLLDEEIRYAANEVTENLDRGLISTGRMVQVGLTMQL